MYERNKYCNYMPSYIITNKYFYTSSCIIKYLFLLYVFLYNKKYLLLLYVFLYNNNKYLLSLYVFLYNDNKYLLLLYIILYNKNIYYHYTSSCIIETNILLYVFLYNKIFVSIIIKIFIVIIRLLV